MEFGVYQGFWLEQLDEACRSIGLERPIWGFDSFEGLPEVDEQHDLNCWEKGQYAADVEDVAKRLKCGERSYIKLVKGWFAESFQRAEVQAIQELAFVRIDCDLYQPACECLEFIKDRLIDQAILVFDDWGPNLNKGEAKACAEWLPNCGMRFEFLAWNSIGHLYLKAHKL